MKLFKIKKAFTLVELVTSITIGTIVITIVVFFIASSIKDISNTNVKAQSIDEAFTFKDEINRYIKGGMNDFDIYGSGSNNSIVLKNNDLTQGIIFGVINNNTKKIQKEYIYDENFIGYKSLSKLEIDSIETNSGVIYDFIFSDDKMYHNMLIKDFKSSLYNGGDILDINFSVINIDNNGNFGSGFEDVFINPLDINEFNLVF